MKKIYVFIGIFLALALSRFIPHPPNFTTLIALSFYIPALVGLSYLPALLISFVITDLIIGFHSTIFFTWGSVLIIGLISRYFLDSIFKRIGGVLIGACIFFIVTNFGYWFLGYYGYTFEGFLLCYALAIPFFAQSLISTFLYSAIIELVISYLRFKKLLNLKKI